MIKRNRRYKGSDTAGFLTVSLLGCFDRFFYGLSGGSPLAAVFTPMNDSPWERLKLLFFPYIFYLTAEYIICGRKTRGFLFSGVTGLLCGMIFIPVTSYMYISLTGRENIILDLLIFLAAVLISFRIRSARIARGADRGIMKNLSALILIAGMTALFVGFTYFPPASPLFKSPPQL